MLMEGQAEFHSLQHFSGASQQHQGTNRNLILGSAENRYVQGWH